MLAACETGEVFALLEARDSLENFAALYSSVREPWLTRALLLYHARTGSARALELLARAPEPHARHLLDALLEQVRGERAARLHALSALAPLVARRPPWLRCLPAHPLARDLLRAARDERAPVPLLHALLTLAALLPAEPTLATPHWPDLAQALLRPAALDPPPKPPTRDHLQLAQLALFHALYATHPCTLIETLRAECTSVSARNIWEKGLAPLLRSVRLHPALVTGSRQREADAARWAPLEIHDVLAESRRLSVRIRDRPEDRTTHPTPIPAAPAYSSSMTGAPGSGAQAARAASALRPGAEPWFALSDRCGADSAPNTPLPADTDSAEPPEAAVEATPENTPAKETRAQFRFPTDSAAVRAIGRRSQPPSPLRKETSPPTGTTSASGVSEAYSGRLARVAMERRAAESPVPFGGHPPPVGAVARPEPTRSAPIVDPEPLNVEDREVLELTERARVERSWSSAEERTPVARDPRATRPGHDPTPRTAPAPPPRRAASCSPRPRAARTNTVAVQTLDVWPAPYEFLIADFHRNLPDEDRKQYIGKKIEELVMPCERLDNYLSELYSGRTIGEGSELKEQLALVHAQLMYERWRREAHAERNRRLLGRCRQARALELQNAALRDRLRAAQQERDELLARLARPAPSVHAEPAADREHRLEQALAEENAARLRAEAALKEAEAQRAIDAAELRRTRGESFEAARHVEALARAALTAERRAEHVRRLRRELLILAEREARLTGEMRAAGGAGVAAENERAVAEERALRAALLRAETEAENATARADAAAARAHELEVTLGARDAAIGELKRAARDAAEEHAARIKALRERCAALGRAVRAGEARRLERLASVERGGAPGEGEGRGADGEGARGGRPALAECGRVRCLLEHEDDAERS
ncbi:hamartin like protein [Danaus plexippus plexippus]|uniref:Hamartin like protein n=1 Tax=Danaus plexippus plexippus TaxID=278856 RepID=A0A212FC50_DANPL|nr:hamartin like protein [Danaus plexippus plexippus]